MNNPANPRIQGVAVVCPGCGEHGVLLVCVTDVDDIRCLECDGTWTRAELRDLIGGWVRLLHWLDSAPFLKGEE